MDRLDFSVVVTILNEEKSILPLLHSLKSQTLSPKEILLVDAGSTDKTQRLVKTWQRQHPEFPLQLMQAPSVNRSEGRNLAIEQAKNEHVAVTDAGCVADEHWLQELSDGFLENEAVEAVAGYYLTKTHSTLGEIYSWYMAVMPEDFSQDEYLPSSRSIAFTKGAWERAGKYPEQLTTCEDLVFAANLKERCKMAVKQTALVYWHTEMSLSQFFSKMEGYAKGDVLADYKPHVKKIWTVFVRYGLFIVLPPLFLAYLLYPLLKHRRQLESAQAAFLLPAIQLTADAAVLSGAVQGYRRR